MGGRHLVLGAAVQRALHGAVAAAQRDRYRGDGRRGRARRLLVRLGAAAVEPRWRLNVNVCDPPPTHTHTRRMLHTHDVRAASAVGQSRKGSSGVLWCARFASVVKPYFTWVMIACFSDHVELISL